MQAGDRLNFVQPFDPFETENNANNAEGERNVTEFGLIMKQLVFDKPELVQSFDVLEESGFVTVFETSYRLDMPDGSHLHIVAFGHQNEGGVLDAGLSINEHLADGKYNGGYLYQHTADGLSRSTNHPDPEDDSEDEYSDEAGIKDYFSIADIYQGRDELEEAMLSDDPETLLAALAAKATVDDEVMLDMLATSAGFDGNSPYPDELEQVAELIKDAYYFPIHEMSEG